MMNLNLVSAEVLKGRIESGEVEVGSFETYWVRGMGDRYARMYHKKTYAGLGTKFKRDTRKEFDKIKMARLETGLEVTNVYGWVNFWMDESGEIYISYFENTMENDSYKLDRYTEVYEDQKHYFG